MFGGILVLPSPNVQHQKGGAVLRNRGWSTIDWGSRPTPPAAKPPPPLRSSSGEATSVGGNNSAWCAPRNDGVTGDLGNASPTTPLPVAPEANPTPSTPEGNTQVAVAMSCRMRVRVKRGAGADPKGRSGSGIHPFSPAAGEPRPPTSSSGVNLAAGPGWTSGPFSINKSRLDCRKPHRGLDDAGAGKPPPSAAKRSTGGSFAANCASSSVNIASSGAWRWGLLNPSSAGNCAVGKPCGTSPTSSLVLSSCPAGWTAMPTDSA